MQPHLVTVLKKKEARQVCANGSAMLETVKCEFEHCQQYYFRKRNNKPFVALT